MDDSFTCPECGTAVTIAGLAPGRQVRCGFCRRLLEVPFLPRVVKTDWKRRRFERPRWVLWSWVAIGLAVAAVTAASLSRWLDRQARARLDRRVAELITSSEIAESEGDLTRALLELDAALRLQAGRGAVERDGLESLRQRRQVLNRRDATAALDRLGGRDASAMPLGDWLNLKARAESDRELATLVPEIRQRFEGKLQQRADVLLDQAATSLAEGKPAVALDACDSAWALRTYFAPGGQTALHNRIGPLVGELARKHGIVIELARGRHSETAGWKGPVPTIPNLGRSLVAKGYLPRPENSDWRGRWADAPFLLVIERDEHFEGSYMTSENRLTRSEARLVLSTHGRPVWETTPSARTRVPLPGLPAHLAGQLALSTKRSPDVEKLLRDDADRALNERLAFALDHMPSREQAAR